MPESPYIVELTPENAAQVVQSSQHTPVLVDFWADWCAPCKQLMPVLSQLAEDYQGRFLLAKLDTERYQDLAAQFGIRNLPTCKLIVNGQIADEFSGALPEAEVRAFLDKHLPRPTDSLATQALQALQAGDIPTALTLLQQAKLEDPNNPRIDITIAQAQMANGDSSSAETTLDALPADQQDDPEVKAMREQLQFAAEAADLNDIETLERRLVANPKDSEARYQLAIHKVQQPDYEGALELLLTLMRDDSQYNDGIARKTLLKLFDLLGDDPLSAVYRRKMFTLLH